MMRQALLALSRSKPLGHFMTESRIAWSGAKRFVAGRTVDEAVAVVRSLNADGLSATLDYLGENVTTQAEADAAADAYIEAIDAIRAAGCHSGVSLKLTAIGLDLGDDVAAARLERILAHAQRKDPAVFVRIDMEGSAYTARTIEAFERARAGHDNVGIVLQSYLRRTAADADRLAAAGAHVRVVKGAYLEADDVAFQDKADVDLVYTALVERMLAPDARAAGAYVAVATHDPAMIAHAKAFAADHGVARDAFEFQMLYGIRRDLQHGLAAEGYRVRVYVPYGRQWYPYFMRRLAERPENVGFVLRNVLRES
ncbi:MAG: proline dehydrogenase family protein [Ardenticatenales bacterium]